MFHPPPTRRTKTLLALGAVDLINTHTDSALQFGTYQVRLYTPHQDDVNKYPLADCRFWPDIRRPGKPTTAGNFEDVPEKVAPNNVQHHLDVFEDHYWATTHTHLSEDLLVGPFDFTFRRVMSGPRNKSSKLINFVPQEQWDKLTIIATRRNLDTTGITTTPQSHTDGE